KALVGEAPARLSTLAAELARPESIGSFYLANDLRRQTRRRLWLLWLRRDRWRQENHLPLLFRSPFASQLLFQWPPAVRADVEFPAIYLLFETFLLLAAEITEDHDHTSLPFRVYARRLDASRPSAGEIMAMEVLSRFDAFAFGSIRIDDVTYEHDVVIEQGEVRKRKKKPSKKYRGEFGHTPLSAEEEIPWTCRRLVIGTGTGALPVMDEVKREAARRKIKLLILPTVEAIEELNKHPRNTNAILHVTC